MYKERVDSADYIYLIRSGEFDIEKTISQALPRKIDINEVLAEEDLTLKDKNVVDKKKMRKTDDDSEPEEETHFPKRNKVAMIIGEETKAVIKKQTCKLACLG